MGKNGMMHRVFFDGDPTYSKALGNLRKTEKKNQSAKVLLAMRKLCKSCGFSTVLIIIKDSSGIRYTSHTEVK